MIFLSDQQYSFPINTCLSFSLCFSLVYREDSVSGKISSRSVRQRLYLTFDFLNHVIKLRPLTLPLNLDWIFSAVPLGDRTLLHFIQIYWFRFRIVAPPIFFPLENQFFALVLKIISSWTILSFTLFLSLDSWLQSHNSLP